MTSPLSAPTQPVDEVPFVYRVAENLRSVSTLPRSRQLEVWREVLDLYHGENRRLHGFLRRLKHEPFVDELLEDDIFWGLVGTEVTREYYARASEYLPTVYATAALLAALEDKLPLSPQLRGLVDSDK